MTKFYSNKALSEEFGIPLTKTRRYSKELLPPDLEATQSSGKSRKLSLREAFKIYLCAHMITKMGLLMEDVKKILADLDPWLEQNGHYPDLPPPRPDEIIEVDMEDHQEGAGTIQQPWRYFTEIRIMRGSTPSGFFYRTIKEIERKPVTKKGRPITNMKFEEGYIIPLDMRYIIDNLNIYLLPITALLGDFNRKLVMRTPF